MEYSVLNNKINIPMEGFGVFQVRDKDECKQSVLDAIRSGYRLIDTAASYTNEDAVGEAVREAIKEGICTRTLPRRQLWRQCVIMMSYLRHGRLWAEVGIIHSKMICLGTLQ